MQLNTHRERRRKNPKLIFDGGNRNGIQKLEFGSIGGSGTAASTPRSAARRALERRAVAEERIAMLDSMKMFMGRAIATREHVPEFAGLYIEINNQGDILTEERA